MALLCRLIGHQWQDEVCEATCARCGYTKGAGHQWQGSECEAVCQTCRRKKGLGHNWQGNTCKSTCTRCKSTRGHDWQGNECESICTRCKKKKGAGHRWQGNACESVCTRCKKAKGAGHSWKYVQDLEEALDEKQEGTPNKEDAPLGDTASYISSLLSDRLSRPYFGNLSMPSYKKLQRLLIPKCDQTCERCGLTRVEHSWEWMPLSLRGLEGVYCSRCYESAPSEVAAKFRRPAWELDLIQSRLKTDDYDAWRGPIVSAKGSLGCSSKDL